MLRGASNSVAWLQRVVGASAARAPAATVSMVASAFLVRATHLIAFILPLKILLLVATPGVPRYLRAFVDESERDAWIVGLSIAAFLFFLSSLALSYGMSRLERSSSGRVNPGGVVIRGRRDPDGSASFVFRRACEAYGDLWFVLTGTLLGLYLDHLLFGGVMGLVLLQALLLSAALPRMVEGEEQPRATLTRVWPKLSQGFVGFNFLVGFGVLLYGFLALGHDQVLVALISLLLLRQVLNTLARFVQHSLRLRSFEPDVSGMLSLEDVAPDAGGSR